VRGQGCCVFLYLVRVSRTCAILADVGVFVYDGGGIVARLNIYMGSVFLPRGSLLMVETLCGVDEH